MFLGGYDLRREYPGSIEVARQADLIVTQAMANLPKINRFGVAAERVAVIRDGIDIASIARVPPRKVRYRVVTVARLVAKKRVDHALHAFAAVRRFFPDATLRVIGDGPERPRLEKLASDQTLRGKVEFLGFIPHCEVLNELRNAEVMLHTSEEDVIPNAAKEAVACGCAVVVTDTPGIRELISPGVGGIIVPVGDYAAGADAVALLLREPHLRVHLCNAGIARLQEEFDLSHNIGKLLELWQTRVDKYKGDSNEAAR